MIPWLGYGLPLWSEIPRYSLAPSCSVAELLSAPHCIGDTLEPEEERLYSLLMAYRQQHNLPPISLAPSLNLVANRHARDLDQHFPAVTHSWSNCPYNPAIPSTYPCMWSAPQRLGTSYPTKAYETAFGQGGSYRATAAAAFSSWQRSSAHRDVFLNQGMWQSMTWQAIGIGIYNGYAVVWVGDALDPAASP